MPKEAIAEILKDQLKEEIPKFNPGDTVRVKVKIVEGKRTRHQSIEGIVIRKRGADLSATFTIRRVSHEVGLEQTFPLHSPNIEEIKIVSEGKVRRSKLYYLRKRSARATVKVKRKMVKKSQ